MARASCALAGVLATLSVQAADVPVQQRNRCGKEYALVATLEGHGTEKRLTPGGTEEERPMWIPTVAVDDGVVVSGDATGVVKVWSMKSDPAPLNDKCVATAKEHADGVTGLWVRAGAAGVAGDGGDHVVDGRGRIVSSSRDGTVKVWDLAVPAFSSLDAGKRVVATLTVAQTLTGHNGSVNGVAVVGHTVASAGDDGTVRLWSLLTGEVEATLEGHTAAVNNVAMRGDVVVSASDDKTVRAWSVERRECTHTFEAAHTGWVFGVALHRHTIISTSFDKTVKVWSLAAEKMLYHLDADIGLKLAVSVDGDGMVVARGPTNDAKVYAFRGTKEGWRCVALLRGGQGTTGHEKSVMAAAISGETVVTAGKDGVVKVWQVEMPPALASSKAAGQRSDL